MPDTFSVRSSAFRSGDPIPRKYTCEGSNVSPPFSLGNIPDETASLAIIADDPDAPRKTFTHWLVYNLPADVTAIAENVDVESGFASDVAAEGVNDFGDIGYGGPCPPPGLPHHYHFRFYALDTVLDLDGGATKTQVTQGMAGHILAEVDVIGVFGRST